MQRINGRLIRDLQTKDKKYFNNFTYTENNLNTPQAQNSYDYRYHIITNATSKIELGPFSNGTLFDQVEVYIPARNKRAKPYYILYKEYIFHKSQFDEKAIEYQVPFNGICDRHCFDCKHKQNQNNSDEIDFAKKYFLFNVNHMPAINTLSDVRTRLPLIACNDNQLIPSYYRFNKLEIFPEMVIGSINRKIELE